MTKLLLIEDHPIFAEALVQALEQKEDLNVVMVVDTAEKALQVIPDLNPELILMDISLPTMSGIDLVAVVHQLYPHIPCLMISGHMSTAYLKRCLAAGARGYAIKDSVKGIIEGIYQVMRGEIYISNELLSP
jgi:DNA-binding NarL/FixJ family response regulator